MARVGTLLFLLVVVVAAMAGLYYYGGANCELLGNVDNEDLSGEKSSSSYSYVEVVGEKEVAQNRAIVSDRFVGDFDNDGKVVAISSNGQAYIVQEGVVLVDDMVVSSSNEEYSVYRIENPEFSVSSN